MPDPSELVEQFLNIHVVDRNQRPIPGAKVAILINGTPVVSGVTKGAVGAPLTLQTPQTVKTVSLRVQYPAEAPTVDRLFTVDLSEGNFNASLTEVVMPSPGRTVPPWFPIAGYFAGLVTLLFFMYVALFQAGPATFAHIFVGAFGAALSAAFLGGDASAKGHLPIPFLNNNPVAASATGGIAVFIIALLLGSTLFLRKSSVPNPDYISINAGPAPVTLGALIAKVKDKKGVNVVFSATCPVNVSQVLVTGGEHKGDSVKDFLENLQYMIEGPQALSYTVRSEKGLRYVLECSK
ncbi:MAG TPA: hypothetical protein VH988_00730 [Thermoanaerobaculia bacterium]|jgi:hypothetical protein|nr:hypothetical protein [Thermoanaerobaculia bacterium]